MANNFQIQISAVDKASEVFRKVNTAVNQLTRPFEQVGQSFKSLGKELGFQRLGKNLGQIGREAKGAASGVASIVAPMAAVTGIGSVAGIIALADGWARLGRSTANTAGNIGINAGELQKFQGAARLAGLSSEDMASSLQGLSSTMENAKFGRDNSALMLFNRLTGGMKHTAAGALDVTGEFKAMATAIAKLKNPQEQMLAAQKFGMQALLPLIRQGPEAFQALQDRAESLGLVMSGSALKAATDFANSLDNLHGAGTGLKNSIIEQITPAIKPLVDELAGWISQNRTLIAQDVGAWAKDFATWVNSVDWKGVGSGIHNFVKGIGTVVDHLGGWKGAAIAVGVVMNAALIGSVVSLGVTLARGGMGLLTFIGMLSRWKFAARSAAAAQVEANAVGAAAGRGALGIGLGAAAVVGTSLALTGDKSEDTRDAENLQNAAMAGDRGAAERLATQQLDHWWSKATPQEISARADDIASGKQAGYSPELMAKLHPAQATAEKQLTGLEQQYHLPAGLLDKVWKQESSRGANLLSPKGAKGHFGFMDPTAQQYGVTNPNDFTQSADGAARMYRDLLKANGGNLDKALAAYNWGQGNLTKKGLDQAPEETRNYIREIKAGMGTDQAPQGPISSGKNETPRHAIDLTFNGLPSGVSAKAHSPSGADVSTKIGYSVIGGVV
ncbi:transglycosylase SLT domain-containing protein [Pseudomonas fluorescens group sp. PF-69]